MSYVIEKDNKDKPPAFLHAMTDLGAVWSTLDAAQAFADESLAQSVIDANDLRDVAIMPFNEEIGE